MALFKIFGNFASGNTTLPTTYTQGYCYFDKNTGKFWVDTTNAAAGRMALNAEKADKDSDGNVFSSTYVKGPASATNGAIATYNGTGGKTIQNSAKTITTSAPTSSATDSTIPTSKAVWSAISSNDTKVTQTAITATTSADYRILLSGSTNDTTETKGANKNTNLRFNTGTKTLSVGGSIDATGNLSVTGNTTLSGATSATNLTAGSLVVTGPASFAQSPTAPTPASTSNDTTVATTAFVNTITSAYVKKSGDTMTGNLTINTLTASQAVSTDANKKLVSTNLTTADPTASGTGITYIATISQSATGKITATKSTVRSASTSQTGVTQYTEANTNTQLSTLSTSWTTAPTDDTLFIRRDTGGSAAFGQVKFSTLWTYIKGKITAGTYWANIKISDAAKYNAAPEMATIKLNGNTSASAASTSNVTLVYNATTQALDFVFA